MNDSASPTTPPISDVKKRKKKNKNKNKNLENTSLQNGTGNSCDSIEADQSQIVNYSEQQSTTEEIPKPKKKKTKEMHVEDESLIEQKETPKKKKIKVCAFWASF